MADELAAADQQIHVLHRKVKDGLWGIAKGTDSVFNPQDVKKWYDSRIKAMTAMKRTEKYLSMTSQANM